MLIFIICGLLFSITANVESKSDYDYYFEAEGWLKLHKTPATWQQASQQCTNEGSILASPLNKELLQVMQSIIDANNNTFSYYIGANSKSSAQFRSIEGIPLASMPVSDMYQELQTSVGDCLAINGDKINVVSCSSHFLYMCFKKEDSDEQLTECGTFDKEYNLRSETGSCYKVHRNLKTWLEANALCISEGAYLVILNDDQEARMITAMTPNIQLPWPNWTNWEPLFIGLRAWVGHRTWLTVHGQKINNLFHGWHDNQPDSTTTQYCGAITKLGRLDDTWCDRVSYFVCEKNPAYKRYFIEDETNNNEIRF